jgi:hypothetical protein
MATIGAEEPLAVAVVAAIRSGDVPALKRLLTENPGATAEYLLDRGADLNWVPPWENVTPLDTARRNGFDAVAGWLHDRGARAYG